METFLKDLGEGLLEIERNSFKNEAFYLEAEKNLEKYIEKARDTLKKKQIINPKPQKRFARIVESESDDEPEVEFKTPQLPVSKPLENAIISADNTAFEIRPVRSAKIAASKNLKEQPQNIKMRNNNNITVVVKSERMSAQERMSKSRDSLKENSNPKENSIVEEFSKDNVRRSQSVEIIPTKAVEIDITNDDSDRMPPPAMPIQQKKAKTKKVEEVDPTQPLPIRVTRSKIKKEKVSVGKTQSETVIEKTVPEALKKSQSDSSVLQNTLSVTSTKPKKKYPMPILVKIERISEDKRPSKDAVDTSKKSVEKEVNNETFNLPNGNENVTTPINNETITLETGNANLTVTLDKNTNDSLMTEDNDEEEQESMHIPLSQLSSIPNALKLKKNEVFNPFMASPVKKKVEAFEKHAMDAKTPEKGKMSSASATKYNTLKNSTPSKIALYSTKGTTPMSNAKQKYIAAVSTASSSSSVKKSVQKKFSSMSHENQEELKKVQSNVQLEEKRKQREEKQKQVQLQREALEKQKREQTLQAQKEREEKFKKLMQEKEEQKRIEALKKKLLKEQQERKYAEERARKEEALLQSTSASKDDSLYYKVQKQIVVEKQHQALKKTDSQKKVDKNAYDFDMLNTDDSTDDEGRMAKKRPDPPQWSKKQHRKKLIILQSKVNPDIVDTLFSTQPINVDLRAIFPAIDARKLNRNSSAVWNTPPRYSVYAKSLIN